MGAAHAPGSTLPAYVAAHLARYYLINHRVSRITNLISMTHTTYASFMLDMTRPCMIKKSLCDSILYASSHIETHTGRELTDVSRKTHAGDREESGGLGQLDVRSPLITISARIDRCQIAKLKTTLTDAP